MTISVTNLELKHSTSLETPISPSSENRESTYNIRIQRLNHFTEAFGELTDDQKIGKALNPKTKAGELDVLATSTNQEVLLAVIRHPNTRLTALGQLALSESLLVRCEVAKNPKTKRTVIIDLMNQNDIEIWEAILTNPNLPDYILRMLSQKGGDVATKATQMLENF
jgi:hypothetical protein